MENKSIKDHLASYKKRVLKVSQNGMWRNKQYAHVLPEKLKMLNIINSDYYKMIVDKIENSNIKLHHDFHHLNSSQALCFNLFYPLFFENKFVPLLNFFLDSNTLNDTVEKYEFEYVENDQENTNFDLFVKTTKKNYYFEIKYTENEFGKAKNDYSHQQKYNEIYKEKLVKFNNVKMEEFFKYYQIFRNLIYDNGYNFFVFPSYRLDLKETLDKVINNYCSASRKKHIIYLPIEDIVKTALDFKNKKLTHHYELFKEKYFLK